KVRLFSFASRKNLQNQHFFCFLNSFLLKFNEMQNEGYKIDNKNLLKELKNRIFARSKERA
ncbi:MAG: hypothetical protein IJK36_08115, partial [Bacteroidales bacterium]|nr:hypothetical protein [Bacteroidales bacterium]